MRYPLEYSEEYAGTVTFSVLTDASTGARPPSSNSGTADGSESPSAEEQESFDGNNEGQQDVSGSTVQVEQSEVEATSTDPEADGEIVVTAPRGDVTLYLPPGLQYRDNVVYDNVDLGAFGTIANDATLGAMRDIRSGGVTGMAGGIMNRTGDLITGVIDGVTKAASTNLQTNEARFAMSQMARLIPNAGVQAGVRGALGVGANPNTRVLFNKVNLREFAFSFKLIARSAAEAEEIKKIVKFFRTYLYPETFDVGGVEGLGYKFPQQFDIRIHYGGDWEAPRIKRSYLRDVGTTFNATSMAVLPGGEPLECDLTLSFVEYAALERADVEDGF